MSKYKYYIKKPKGEIIKDILQLVAHSGVVFMAMATPNAAKVIMPQFAKLFPAHKRHSASTAFRRLLRDGSLLLRKDGKQVYVELTEAGRKKAGWFQINALKLKKQKRWDKHWHVVIFDIPDTDRLVREALRGFLKRLDFYCLQKSVWISPHGCRDEIELLKDFLGTSSSQLRLIVTRDIGDDTFLRKVFKL